MKLVKCFLNWLNGRRCWNCKYSEMKWYQHKHCYCHKYKNVTCVKNENSTCADWIEGERK